MENNKVKLSERQVKVYEAIIGMVIASQLAIEKMDAFIQFPEHSQYLRNETKHHFNRFKKSLEKMIKKEEDVLYGAGEGFMVVGGDKLDTLISELAKMNPDELLIYSVYRKAIEDKDPLIHNYANILRKRFDKDVAEFNNKNNKND